MKNYLCNLIIPGFPKSGTSSLHDYLDQHPNICMSKPKEPHFFTNTAHWQKGVAYHNGLFMEQDDHTLFFGESSTNYCIWPEAVKRIKEKLDCPKIIFLVRDPVQRLLSHYRWMYKLGLETNGLMKAIMDDDKFHPDKHLMGCYKSYVEFSSYSKFLPIWLENFGKQNIFFISSKDLKENPLITMNECFNFLGLSPITHINMVEKNTTNATRALKKSRFSQRLKKGIPRNFQIAIAKIPLAKKIWRMKFGGRNIKPPEISKHCLQELTQILRKDIDFYKDLSINPDSIIRLDIHSKGRQQLVEKTTN
jgi:hypothetical protein